MTRAAFLGTPTEAIPALHALAGMTEIVLVITQPDRPRGRSGTPQPPPVREAALDLRLRVAQPASKEALVDALTEAAPLEVAVLVAFGMLIPADALQIPERGILNVHLSILPRWRGAAPVARAILAGDSVSGVTIIRMDEGLDTGPVVAARESEIGRSDTAGTLAARLAATGAQLLTEILADYMAGELEPIPQSGKATYAEKLDRAEARLELAGSASAIWRAVRAFNPRPGAFAHWRGEPLKLWVVELGPDKELAPGELRIEESRLIVGTGEGTLELVEVQPAGGRRMTGTDWARGRRGPLGSLE
ncbi:MAG: methionyl-tRNA formyltransferase [Acidimicrobiia bacterium]